MSPETSSEDIHPAKMEDDLVLIHKATGAMLTIEDYFGPGKDAFRASEIHFADGVSYGLWNSTTEGAKPLRQRT